MARRLVALWNIAQTDSRHRVSSTNPWDRMPFEDRLLELSIAVQKAGVEYRMKFSGEGVGEPRWIFMGPEYTFGVDPIPHTQQQQLNAKMAALSDGHCDPLLIPGSAILKHRTEKKVKNHANVYYKGAKIADVQKRKNVGEAGTSGCTFVPGAGRALFSLGGHTCGLQICGDATGEMMLPGDQDLQLVIGRGVGFKLGENLVGIIEQAKKYVIVAECGDLGIKDVRANKRLEPYKLEDVSTSVLHYFEIDL